MGYAPQWLNASSWEESGVLSLGADGLADTGAWPAPVRRARDVAETFGLPREAALFHPNPVAAPFTEISDKAGARYWRLGRPNPELSPGSQDPEYVLDDEGRVLVLDPSLPQPRFVNSSLLAFLDALAAWDHRCEHVDDFDDLEDDDPESDEGADDYVDPAEAARVAFGLEIRDRLRELDPPAFAMDTWWDRVYEEVELDAI
uniref:SUKH-4 family immunity protein n=1 Tax=Streptomyces polyasparticus TaxID=2767826 RepID=UPI00280B6959|nr:SUKH-4 family immunity protein [Streptomyces polyasparticus]